MSVLGTAVYYDICHVSVIVYVTKYLSSWQNGCCINRLQSMHITCFTLWKCTCLWRCKSWTLGKRLYCDWKISEHIVILWHGNALVILVNIGPDSVFLLDCTEPLPEPMLFCFQLDRFDKIWMKKKLILNCCLQNVSHFVLASLC